MRPGPHPWATNDNYAGGPDAGSATKTRPLAVLEQDGYYRARRPAPDLLNWQLNRSYLTQLAAARMQVASMSLIESDTTLSLASSGKLLASCHVKTGSARYCFIFGYNGSGGSVDEYYSDGGGANWKAPSSSPIVSGPIGFPVMDADGDENSRRIVTIDDGTAGTQDHIWYATSTGGGSWAQATFTPGGPNLQWRSVGCDRDTAGNGFAKWCAGDDASGGNSAVWTSTDGIDFSAATGWPGATVTEPLRGIYHTCHPRGSLGPNDAGNPLWLILSDTYASWSEDGETWTTAAHWLALGGGQFNQRSAAYSKTSGRWVAVMPQPNASDVAYSDDKGATWTTISGALPYGASSLSERRIAGDGFGTFVIVPNADNLENCRFWYSVDEGVTWTYGKVSSSFSAAGVGTLDGQVVEGAVDCQSNVDDTASAQQFFVVATHDGSGPATEFHRSLAI